ncbi:MAG: hypothetical protein QY323_02200 [Patescibacteria group bacterium]|nr:MAG: hypothetical protein QY323_02200 [Patescibacteria group bacterium]
MKRSLIFLSAILISCGDPGPSSEPDGAPAPEAPDAAVPPAEMGGEYAIKVTPEQFWCVNSGEQPTQESYSILSIVPQDDWTIDLRTEMRGTFLEFDRYDLERASDGSFDSAWQGYVGFFDILLTLFRDITESAADGRELRFNHRYDVGWDDAQDVYHRECVYDAKVSGTLLHERWDGSPKDGVSGQWHVQQDVLASPLYETQRRALPQDAAGEDIAPSLRTPDTAILFRDRTDGMLNLLPNAGTEAARLEAFAMTPSDALVFDPGDFEPLDRRNIVLTTLSQSPSDDLVDVRGIFQSLGGPVYRDPLTGRVDAWMLVVIPYLDSDGSMRVMLQETSLSGTILPHALALEETWHWWTAATDTLPAKEHWLQHELYSGVPRFMPHVRALAEPPHGTYAALFTLVDNDCGFAPYAYARIVQIMPIDGDVVWPRITGFDREPHVTADANGRFSTPFDRATNFWLYRYAIETTTNGHAIDIDMTVERRDRTTGALNCTSTYEAHGEKLYMTARP